jgi:hypothetical protein
MRATVDDESWMERGLGLWSFCEPFSLLGARFGRRMVVVSRKGRTGVFSPNRGVRRTIESNLGADAKVDFLIAPTAFHDTYFAEAAGDYPKAGRLVSPAFPKGLVEAESLADSWPEEWQEALVPYPIQGMPGVQETVFFDRSTKTLIVSDLVFYFDASWDFWTKTFVRLSGVYGKPRMSRLFRMCIKDKAAFKASLQPLLELPVEHILPSHGKAVLGGGQMVMARLFDEV